MSFDPIKMAAVPVAAPALADAQQVVEELIGSMSIDGLADVYFIGPFTRRVSFASQQMRSLNLIWALCTGPKPLTGDKRVAVIGAGLAGLTAAAGLRSLGLKPQVFEKEQQCFPLQRETTIRYVHPSINFWPELILDPGAQLPFLFWSADIVAKVMAGVQKQWASGFGDVPINFDRAVSGLNRKAPGNPIRLEFAKGGLSDPFDVVIAATGYGLEKADLPSIAPSYWQNLDLRPLVGVPGNSFLVSGVGDGGLLEVLRLVYPNFANGRLTDELAREFHAHGLSTKVKEIEDDARRQPTADATRKTLRTEYLSMDIPGTLAVRVREMAKALSPVTLLAKQGEAFTPNSAPIHKLMLAVAVQKGEVSVEAGELRQHDGALWVCDADGAPKRPVHEKSVVVRHGASGALRTFVSQDQADELKRKQSVMSDYQYRQYWPAKFFGDKDQTDLSAKCAALKARLKTAYHLLEEYPDASSLTFSLAPCGTDFEIALQVDRKTSALEDLALPQVLFGRPVKIEHVDPYIASSMLSEEGYIGGSKRALQVGDKIALSPVGGRRPETEIGCFILAEGDEAPFALSAAHALDASPGASVYARSPDSNEWTSVGFVADAVDEEEANDVVAVKIADSIAVEPGPLAADVKKVVGAENRIGEQVVHAGHDGLRRGVISGIVVGPRITLPNGKTKRLNEALLVRSLEGEASFSAQGDSGSLVKLKTGEAVGVIVAGSNAGTLVSSIGASLEKRRGRLFVEPRPGTRVIAAKAAQQHVTVVEPKSVMRKSSIYDEQSAGYIGRPLIPSLRLSSSYWDADVAPIGAPEEWKDFETQQLFRVYGLRQFMRTGHVRPRDVHSVFVQGSFASRRLHHLWWPGGLSSSLVKRAMRGEPVTFAKAALMIAVVEAFVRDRERSVVIDDAEYRPLTIIPAIYTIDGIVGESAKTWMSNVALRREIDENLGHGAWRILPELLAGKVVTLITAKIVSTLLARFYPDGLFRSSRATSLRRAKAATHESVDELDPAAVSEEGVSYGAKRLD